MNKELEVIKRDLDYEKCLEIVKKQPNCCLAPRVNAINTIEKELKRLEELEAMYSNCVIESTKLNKAFDALSKDHEKAMKELSKEIEKNRALEIIKNKGVFVHLLQQSKNVEEYNSLMLIAFKKMAERDYKGAVEKFCLTQEEYDLLKEVL